MDKLKSTKKITLATLKSFAKRNQENLYVKKESSFSGMSDMVETIEDPQWEKTSINLEKTNYYQTGIQGVYTVGQSRDYFSLYEDETYIGLVVYNCTGSCILTTKK